MKTIVKLVTVNDGNETEVRNKNRMYVASYPRAEAVISGFLSDGWNLHSRTYRVVPSSSGSFYIGGWDLLFTKSIDDNERDNGEKLLASIVRYL